MSKEELELDCDPGGIWPKKNEPCPLPVLINITANTNTCASCHEAAHKDSGERSHRKRVSRITQNAALLSKQMTSVFKAPPCNLSISNALILDDEMIPRPTAASLPACCLELPHSCASRRSWSIRSPPNSIRREHGLCRSTDVHQRQTSSDASPGHNPGATAEEAEQPTGHEVVGAAFPAGGSEVGDQRAPVRI